MTTPSPGTRSRLVRLTHLLSSLDDRRRVNWADNSGSDLTVVRVVSPLPASAYVVSPEATRSGNDSFTRAVQLAAQQQPQQARTVASDATAHKAAPARYTDSIFLRVPPPPVTQQPLPDTAVPRLSSGAVLASRLSSGALLAPASPPSTAIAQARQQPQARPPPVPRAFQPGAAGANRNASMGTLVQTAVLPGPSKIRERRRSSGSACSTSRHSSTADVAKIADLSPIVAAGGVDADLTLAEETAFSRALLMSGPRQQADGGQPPLGTVELELGETGVEGRQEGVGGAESVAHQSLGMASISSAASAGVEASLHSAPSEATSQWRQGLQHAEAAPNSATAKRSRAQTTGALASEMRSPPDRAGGTSIRSLRPASVLLSSMGDEAAARGLNSSLASLFLPAGSRALGVGSSLAASTSFISDAAVAAIRGPRPAVRPLPSLHLPPEEESDETPEEPARAPSPPWIPSGVVGAADTKHVLVRSPVPASSPTRPDGRPAAWRSMTPPAGRDGGAAAGVSPSREERRHTPWDDLPPEEDDLLARPEARVARPFVLRDGRDGAVPVPAVPPLPPAPLPPSVSAAAAIRAYLHDSRSEAPASPVRPRVEANLERSTTPVRERTRQASKAGLSPAALRARTSAPQSSMDSRSESPAKRPPEAPSAQAPQHAGRQQPATRSASQAVAVMPPPYMLQRKPAPQQTERARGAEAASSRGASDHRSRGRPLSTDPGVSIAQALHTATARARDEGKYLRQSPSPGPDLRRRSSHEPTHSPQGRTPQPREYHPPPRTHSPQPAALPSPSPPPRRRARSCCTPERHSVSPIRPSAPPAVAAPAAANTAHDVVEFVRALVNLLDPAPARLPPAASPPPRPALHALRMASPSRKVTFALPPRLVVAAPARNPDAAASRLWVVRDPPAEPPPAAAGRSKRVAWR